LKPLRAKGLASPLKCPSEPRPTQSDFKQTTGIVAKG
jgi:hypothetical protein